MKIIHIFHSLKYSGAEIMYVDAAKLFQEQGCALAVVATSKELGNFAERFQEQGYQIFHKPFPGGKHFLKSINYIYNFSRFLKKNEYDVVHIHSNRMMWGMALSAWMAGKKSVYTVHNVFPTKKGTRLLHILQRWSAKTLFGCIFQTISDSVYQNELKTFKSNTVKIANWYGSNRFYPGTEEEKSELRQTLGIDNNAYVIISVGGCSPIKRHSEVLQALAIVNKTLPECIYLHLGEGDSLEGEKALAVELGIEKNVLFLGNQPDVRQYLVASDLYVMPSKFEGLPITTIEAMGCNIPALLYDVPGLRDFNKKMITCKLISEDFHQLALEIIQMSEHPEEARSLAESAKQFVDKNYNMKINSKKIFDLYVS